MTDLVNIFSNMCTDITEKNAKNKFSIKFLYKVVLLKAYAV